MQTAPSIETRIKCRLHDAFVGELLARERSPRPLDRHELARAMRRPWSRANFGRLVAGPTRHPHSIDKLADVVRALGFDVLDDGTCVPKGARQLETQAAVPLAA